MKILFILLAFLIFSSSSFLMAQTIEAGVRADAAYDSLLSHFWEDHRNDFKGENHYWFYAQSFDIAAMALERHPNQENAAFVERLYQAQLQRGYFQTGTIYYDDENWMAMALIRSWRLTGNPNYLLTATQLFDRVMSAETFDSQGQTRGVWWSSQHTGVATASNMGPVITACMLYQITKTPKYFEFATRLYSHWKETMLVKETYEVVDFRKADGTRVFQPFTYDQGLMIGAAVELFHLTNEAAYLEDARGLTNFTLKKMSKEGILIEAHCQGRLAVCKKNKDLAQFKGITMKFLVELAKVDSENASLLGLIRTTAKAIWERGREPESNLFTHEWDGSDTLGESTYGAANSAAMALGAVAGLP